MEGGEGERGGLDCGARRVLPRKVSGRGQRPADGLQERRRVEAVNEGPSDVFLMERAGGSRK